MAASDDDASSCHSATEAKSTTKSATKRPAAADGEQPDIASKRKHRRTRSAIDFSDAATFQPAKPKNLNTIEDLLKEKKNMQKQQQQVAKATKAAQRKQKKLADKASKLSNEELLEIMQQRRCRQEEDKQAKARAEGRAAQPQKSKASKE